MDESLICQVGMKNLNNKAFDYTKLVRGSWMSSWCSRTCRIQLMYVRISWLHGLSLVMTCRSCWQWFVSLNFSRTRSRVSEFQLSTRKNKARTWSLNLLELARAWTLPYFSSSSCRCHFHKFVLEFSLVSSILQNIYLLSKIPSHAYFIKIHCHHRACCIFSLREDDDDLFIWSFEAP